VDIENLVTEIAVQIIFWSGLAAPAVLGLFWPWWRSELGWSITAKTLALSGTLVSIMIYYLFGPGVLADSAALRWFTIIMLYTIPAIIWWRVWVIYKTQRDGTRHY
jgi:hypothetical protein